MTIVIRVLLLFFFTFLLNLPSLDAQVFDKTKGKNVERLYNQETQVYTYGQGAYTERIKKAFEQYWKITAYKIHDIKNGLPKLADESTVFMPAVVGLSVRDHATSMNHPFYIFGEAGSSGRPNANGIVAAFPINGFHNEFDVTSDSMYQGSLLRIPYIVHTLNDMLTYLKTNGDEKGFYKTIEAKSTRIAGKTLLIPAELIKEYDVNPNSTALMKANLDAGKKPMKSIMAAVLDQSSIRFNGKYKILPAAEIMKLEQSADAGKYSIFLPAIDHKKFMMVFDLQTKELLYYEFSNMGMKIKEKDFEKLNKAAGL